MFRYNASFEFGTAIVASNDGVRDKKCKPNFSGRSSVIAVGFDNGW